MSDKDCNQCATGIVEGVAFPKEGSVDSQLVDGGLKISTVNHKLKISNTTAKIKPDAQTNDASCCAKNTPICLKPAKFKLPNWVIGASCAMEIKLSGLDAEGSSATLCGSGYPVVKDGWVTLEENPSVSADCLHHAETNGMVGEPLAFEHIAITDPNGKVKSQKPKAGKMNILLGDGVTMQWRQVCVEDIPICHKGGLDKTASGELMVLASPSTPMYDPNGDPVCTGEDTVRCVKGLSGEGIPFTEKILDPACVTCDNDGYRYVTTYKTVDEMKTLLGIT